MCVQAWLQRALWDVVPRDHRQSQRDLRRRQLITAGFVLLGAVVLGFLLRMEPGSVAFYVTSMVVAAVWLVGAFASGPIHLGRIPIGTDLSGPTKRPITTPLALGAALACAKASRATPRRRAMCATSTCCSPTATASSRT